MLRSPSSLFSAFVSAKAESGVTRNRCCGSDMRNRVHVMQYDGDRTSYGVQPFGDADHVRFAPGRAVVMRTRGPPGTLELLEVDGEGDTLWHRNVQLVPSRLTEAVVERRVARYMEAMEGFYDHVPRQELRARYREGLYTPAYLPAADGPPVLSASGGVWIRTHEVSDTLRAYYVLERGDPNTELRRVLLPEWLRVSDATATHVLGCLARRHGCAACGRPQVGFRAANEVRLTASA